MVCFMEKEPDQHKNLIVKMIPLLFRTESLK